MAAPPVHTTGINVEAVLAQVALIGGLLAGLGAFIGRTLIVTRRFIASQVREVTRVQAEQLAQLDRRTVLMSWAGAAALAVTGALAAADLLAGRNRRWRR